MIRRYITEDISDLLFRLLFSSIFLGLGLEHLFHDNLIQGLMPDWLPLKRFLSMLSGVTLLCGGSMILVGFRVHMAAVLLGAFLITVTLVVHIPALMIDPPGLPMEWQWLWDLYQQSNLVKNLCLLGVCFHLLYHQPGKYSLDGRVR